MSPSIKPLDAAVVATLILSAALVFQEPDPKQRFEPFGREEKVREMIASGFKATAKVDIGKEDLDRATDEVLAGFRGWPEATGRRSAEEFLHRQKVGELKRGYAVLQLRAGAGGGNPNQIRFTGKTSPYVRSVSTTPLKLGGPVAMDEKATAYFQAGYVPKGKVFVIKSIEYWGTAKGDTNGHGEFLIRLPGVLVEQVKDTESVERKKWKGRVVIRPGLEDQVWLEVANSSQGEAIFRGMLVDEKYADPSVPFPLSPEGKLALEKLLPGLEAELVETREAAAKAIYDLGPGVVDRLKAVHAKATSAVVKANIEAILDQLGEDP